MILGITVLPRNGSRARYYLCLAICILGLQVFLGCARARIRVITSQPNQLTLVISGTITKEDARIVEGLSRQLDNDVVGVDLDSEGGDVQAAMRIGRVIRQAEAITFVARSRADEPEISTAKCYSSCALIFIAGVTRVSYGELGLHRPYLANAPQSRQAIETELPIVLSEVRKYISDMGITESFYDLMVNTDPMQMRVYNGNEYLRLMPKDDPIQQEIEIAYQARHYGTSTAEMRVRTDKAEGCMRRSNANDYLDCYNAALWGVSEQTFREREAFLNACYNADDYRFLLTLPTKTRRDNPVFIKREKCEQNAMLR